MNKQKVLLISQYFPPDMAGTGIVMEELAEDLQIKFDVIVLAGKTFFFNQKQYKSYQPKVEVKRIWHPHWNKNSFIGRLLNFLFFPLTIMAHFHLLIRAGKIIIVSNPATIIAIGALAHILFKKKVYYIWQDMYPDLAVSLQTISASSILTRIMLKLNAWGFQHVEKIILLAPSMQKYFASAYSPWLDKTSVISNWADTNKIYPESKDNPWSQVSGYKDLFVVLYAGNLGQAYNFEPVVDAAIQLKNEKSIVFLFVGEGAQKLNLEKIKTKKNLTNIDFMSYVPNEDYNKLLATGDCHLVSIKPGIDKLSYPGKIYSSMAAGRPIIAICEPISSLAQEVQTNNIGFAVNNGYELVEVILKIKNDPNLAKTLGQNSRALSLKVYSRLAITKKYLDLLS